MSSKTARSRCAERLPPANFHTPPRNEAVPKIHRILTVTDHEMSREWLSGIIGRESDLWVGAEAGDFPAARALIVAEAPSMVILESPLHGVHSFDLLKELQAHSRSIPILVFGDTISGALAEAAIRAGAKGYVHRRDSKAVILAAIRHLLTGGIHVSEANAHAMFRRMSNLDVPTLSFERAELSSREREVLALLGSGYKPSAIASQLSISIRTIESYSNRMRQKLNIESASELVLFAVAWMRSQPTPEIIGSH